MPRLMIDSMHVLSLTRQAQVAGISRGSVYYLPKPVSVVDLARMRRIDALHLEHPFAVHACCAICWRSMALGRVASTYAC